MQGKLFRSYIQTPGKLNARNYETFDRFDARLDAFEEGSMFQSIILTGANERAFSASAEIHDLSESTIESAIAADLRKRGF